MPHRRRCRLCPRSGDDYFHARPGTRQLGRHRHALPSVSQFFTAKNLLDRHRIVNRMDDQDGDTNEVDLMVLASEAEWARDVLSKRRFRNWRT